MFVSPQIQLLNTKCPRKGGLGRKKEGRPGQRRSNMSAALGRLASAGEEAEACYMASLCPYEPLKQWKLILKLKFNNLRRKLGYSTGYK